jgi:hypothetical protein
MIGHGAGTVKVFERPYPEKAMADPQNCSCVRFASWRDAAMQVCMKVRYANRNKRRQTTEKQLAVTVLGIRDILVRIHIRIRIRLLSSVNLRI